MKTRMPAVECNYHENKLAADRLYNNDEWISTGHAAGLRSKHREECTGETAQRRHGKDGLQQTVCGVLPAWENRVFTEDSAEKARELKRRVPTFSTNHFSHQERINEPVVGTT